MSGVAHASLHGVAAARLAVRALAAALAILLGACEAGPDATSPEPAASPAPPPRDSPAGPARTAEPPAASPAPPAPESTPGQGGAADPPAPAFLAPREVVATAGSGEVATAVGLRAGSHPGFDRLVLELDRFPGTRVEWLDGPPIRCGSGEVASLPGAAFLEVRLEPAKAHDEAGALTLQSRELRPALPAVGSVAITCDFEAVLVLAVGAPDRLPFRVSRLDGPPRLVIDLRHSP